MSSGTGDRPGGGSQPTRVRVLSLYPEGIVPCARFRYEQFVGPLAERGIVLDIDPFFSPRGYRAAVRGGTVARLAAGLGGLARRIRLLLLGPRASIVWVHRQATPLPSRLVEWAMKHLWRARVVYEFDDAVWLPQEERHRLGHWLLNGGKIPRIVADADAVIAGNGYLADYARAGAADVTVIPTVVNTGCTFNTVRSHGPGTVTIGWTGSSSTFGCLEAIAPVLREIEAERDVRFLFIGDVFRPLGLARAEEVRWSVATEVSALARCDIGLMPLPDNAWTRGKCGFKIVQYMALGIVPVASAVGANLDIIDDGADGFLCRSDADWKRTLLAAIDDPELRARIGRAARAKAERQYSVASQVDRLCSVLTGEDA